MTGDASVNTRLLEQLAGLGFQPPRTVQGRLSIADLVPLSNRRGLYVLHAPDDQHYLGRTEDFSRRYREHLENHPDVQAISLMPIRSGDLHQREQTYIRTLEAAGFTLRNSAGMSMPLSPGSDLDDLVPPEDQERWRRGETPAWSGRSRDEALRLRQARTYARFQASPRAAEMQSLIRTYVENCIIAPGRTEISLWSVTCFPKGGFRVNASWQEVFRTLDGREYFLLAAPSVLRSALGPQWEWKLKLKGFGVEHQMYSFPGPDHVGLFADGAEGAEELLSSPAVRSSARELAWRVMRMRPNPNSRSHAPQLVDFLDLPR